LRSKKLKIFLIILGILVILIVTVTMGISYYVGWNLTHPKRNRISKTPASYNLTYHTIHFVSRIDHLHLKGWIIPSDSNNHEIVIEAHGYRDNRSNIKAALPIANALHKAGIAVIMFDFRAEGESPGKIVSVGEYEIRDLLGAVDYARSINYKHIGVIGYSMGASTAIMATGQDTLISAIVADSPFANLNQYLKLHMSTWTNLPNFPFTPEILWELKVFNGLDPSKVAPDRTLKSWKPRPMLLIAGTADKKIPVNNSRLLYSEIKKYSNTYLWIVNGAKHVGAFSIEPAIYKRKVVSFFKKYLQKKGNRSIVNN
jgi:fermentation-respiration switch protein FrsA (DUF1100 family)